MPNATVRANAQVLPEAPQHTDAFAASPQPASATRNTAQPSRRGLLGGISALCAGAAGAAAAATGATALPAAAAEVPKLSAVDRQVLELWERRAKLQAVAERCLEQYSAASDRLPEWARSGPVYLRTDGRPSGLDEHVGWPAVADLSLRPVNAAGFVKARLGPQDIRDEFSRAMQEGEDRVAVIEKHGRAFVEFAERIRAQNAEENRLGIDTLGGRCDAANEAVAGVENEFDQYLRTSVLALACVLMIAIEDGCEDIEGLNRAALAAIRPLLSSAIAQDADRVLADPPKEEVA
jgi:hypothetical protein